MRRGDNPQCISRASRKILFDGVPLDLTTQLIGSDVKFHHAKINLELSGNRFEVDFHHDFSYTLIPMRVLSVCYFF